MFMKSNKSVCSSSLIAFGAFIHWLLVFLCFIAGMLGQYNVGNCKSGISHPKMKGQQRRYFIAAEKILWDYGPQGYDKFSGLPLNASGR